MENKTEFPVPNLTKEELIVVKMGLTQMVEFFQKENWNSRMYQAALHASNKFEQALRECGVIKTIEYKI